VGPVVEIGSMTYKSMQAPKPLSELEEAYDRRGPAIPDDHADGVPGSNSDELIMAKPNLSMEGAPPEVDTCAAHSLINDRGTYFINGCLMRTPRLR